MKSSDIQAKVTKGLKFLPTSIHKLIYANIISGLDTASFNAFNLVDLERMVNMNDRLIHCKATFQYGKLKSERVVFTMKFKTGKKGKGMTMKSFQWSA